MRETRDRAHGARRPRPVDRRRRHRSHAGGGRQADVAWTKERNVKHGDDDGTCRSGRSCSSDRPRDRGCSEIRRPMVLRGLIYQLTGDPELLDLETKSFLVGFFEGRFPATDAGTAFLREGRRLLKAYRDDGAGEVDIGPKTGSDQPAPGVRRSDPRGGRRPLRRGARARPLGARARWKREADPKAREAFTVTIVGAGMGGLNAAVHLNRAGIPYTVSRRTTASAALGTRTAIPARASTRRAAAYTHLFGVDFGYPNPFLPAGREHPLFRLGRRQFRPARRHPVQHRSPSMTWDEAAGEWDLRCAVPTARSAHRSRAVITGVGFLNRPQLPEIHGKDRSRAIAGTPRAGPRTLISPASASPSSAPARPATK